VQELLNTGAASLHAGAGCIQWKELRTISSWLASDDLRGKEPHNYPWQVSTPGIWSIISPISQTDISSTSFKTVLSGTRHTVVEILMVYLSPLDLKARDQRNKTFAILSLPKDTMIENNIPKQHRPNYRNPWLQSLRT
jgi:hypothetical protein